MILPWHLANPLLFEKEKAEVEASYPNLHVHVVDDVVFVRGTFPVAHEGEVFDRYQIEIELPRGYPGSIPVVREIGGRIPCIKDFHMNPSDGTACVLLLDERWEVWPIGSSLLEFLNVPVRNFFLGQSLVERGDAWPFGHWKHGTDGIREYYAKLLGTDDVRGIKKYLEYLSKKKIKGHWPCACNSGKRLRDCHGDAVRGLSRKMPRQVASELRDRIAEMFRSSSG